MEAGNQIALMGAVVGADEGAPGIAADSVGERPFSYDSLLKSGEGIGFKFIGNHGGIHPFLPQGGINSKIYIKETKIYEKTFPDIILHDKIIKIQIGSAFFLKIV